ncbi:polyadenylate-binding protein, putative [Medicago truncatula]|uniref:Polyadenylate-binding protein, putative n=1 Tax=Medicago truncatula TaxID=3880 RepID=A0A072UAB7_MEDTR|nr:polyadenylate-binding protein, putative [Medicago truncatula]
MRSAVAPNYILPYQLQRQGHPGHGMGMRPVGNFQQVQQNQMLPRNTDQGFTCNGRNGVDPSAVSEGQTINPSLVSATRENQHGYVKVY